MPIDLACPSCRRPLQVPDYAAGKKARCPACGEIIPVPALERTVNPYAAPSASTMAPQDQEFSPPEGPLDFGRVWNEAWAAWSRNLGVLVGATVIFFVISFGIGFVLEIGQDAAIVAMGEPEAGDLFFTLTVVAMSIGGHLLTAFIQSYFFVGFDRMALDAARGRPVEFGRLFSGGDVLIGYFFYYVVFELLVGVGTVACLFPGLALGALFWPGFYAIADRRATFFEAFGYSLHFIHGNFWTSILLLLVLCGVNIVGVLACGIGLLFSAPLQYVLLATAYRHMAGDPKSQQASNVLDPMSGQGMDESPFA